MSQTTLKKGFEIVGIGLHSGVPVSMRLLPAPEDFGIVFIRVDTNTKIHLNIESVVDTKLATVIGHSGVVISTIEHLLSAITAFGIDNVLIEIDNDEVPIMDGSSISFCMMFEECGIEFQNKKKRILKVKKEVEITDGEKFVKLTPSDRSEFLFKIRFNHPAIKTQELRFDFSKENYIAHIARARTFGFIKELNYLRSIGKAKGAGFENAIGLDDRRILNKEGLRFPDEFVRHKILDAIGDMAFLGMPFMGMYSSFAGSHHLNHLLVVKFLEDSSNYEVVS